MIQNLTDWFKSKGDNIVAINGDSALSFYELQKKVRLWCSLLKERPEQTWGIYFENLWESISVILALCHLKKIPCLLGDATQMANPDLSSKINTFLIEETFNSQNINQLKSDFILESLDANQCIYFLTSGTSGQPKMVKKKLYQLVNEIKLLQEQWPQVQDVTFIGCVSHQHLYGFTFRFLWPFLTGSIFEVTVCRYTEDIARQARELDQFVLIASPSHLSRLSPGIDWLKECSNCSLIISSAAPLLPELSHQISLKTGKPVFEIYGSTETGIIAWKCQQKKDHQNWTLFSGIQINFKNNQCILISPLLDHFFLLEDKIEILDAQFKLLGRADRIVKVEGKRVDLASLETVVTQHAAIKSACAIVVDLKNRVEIAIVCEIDNLYLLTHKSLNFKALKLELMSVVKMHFAQVLCPRRWRFVHEFPKDARGKTALQQMKKWFLEERNRFPQIAGYHQVEANTCEFELYMSPAIDFFKGHFDDAPILPGVAQIHWAAFYGDSCFAIKKQFKRLEVVKFQQVISPGQTISLKLSFKPESHKLLFTYVKGAQVFSSGRICYDV